MNAGPERVLLLGGAGTGKSHLLRTEFQSADPQRRMLLLPTASLVRHTRDLLTFEPGAALLGNGLTTLPGLSLRLLAEREGLGQASDALCLSVVRALLQSGSTELAALAAAAAYTGFGRTALGWLRELRQAGMSAGRLTRSNDEPRRATAALLRGYEARLEQLGLVDIEMALARAAAQLKRKPLDGPDLLVVDGFYEFTLLQAGLLDALIESAERCLVSLVWPQGRGFALLQATRDWFVQRGFVERALDQPRRFKSAGLMRVEQGLFARADADNGAAHGIELFEALDPQDEARAVARDIAISRAAGRSYDEHLIVRRNLGAVADIWRRVFAETGVPLEVLQPRSLISHQAVIELVGLYRALIDDLSAFPWMLSAVGLGVAEPELRQAVELARGQRQPQTLREAATMLDGQGLVATSAALNRLIQWQDELRRTADWAAALSVLDRIALEIGVAGAIELYRTGADDEHELRAAALRRLREVLQERARLGPEQPSGASALAALEAALRDIEAASFERGRRQTDAVFMVDVLEARNWEAPLVYLTGLNQREFPPRLFGDALFSDEERSRLARSAGLRTAEQRIEEERLLFYLAATRASERLVLSRAAFDESGGRLTRSFWLDDLLGLFDSVPRLAGPGGPDRKGVVLRSELRRSAAAALGRRRSGLGSEPQELELANALSAADPTLRGLARRAAAEPRRAWLRNPGLVRGLRAQVEPLSASAADTFAQCPFRYFCSRLLRLQGSAEPARFDARAEGLVAHEVLRQVFEQAQFEQWPDLLEREIERAVRKFGEPDDLRGLRLRLMAALNRTIRGEREWLESAGARPAMFERQFGADEGPGCAIAIPSERAHEFPGSELRLGGRIDRVDVLESEPGRCGLVVDYKLSSRGWRDRREQVEQGLDNQPAIYLLALESELDLIPAGMFYVACLQERREGIAAQDLLPEQARRELGGSLILDRDGLAAWLQAQRARLLELAARIYRGTIAARPARLDQCGAENCEFADVCRFRPEWEGAGE